MTPEQREFERQKILQRIQDKQRQGIYKTPEPESNWAGRNMDRLAYGTDRILENIGDYSDTFLGTENAKKNMGSLIDMSGYKSDSEQFMNGDNPGFGWDHLDGALVEQAPDYLANKTAAWGGGAAGGAAGAAFGGVGAIPGAVIGTLTGSIGYGITQVAPEVAQMRAQNNGRQETNWVDGLVGHGVGAVSGALGAIPFMPGGKTLAAKWMGRAVKEGATEAIQSGVEQTGSSLGTEAGLDLSLKQMVGEGILGAASSGAVEGVTNSREIAQRGYEHAKNGVEGVRYDNDNFDATDVRIAQRFREQGTPEQLANVSTTDGQTSAQGLTIGVVGSLRAELNEAFNVLKNEAKTDDQRVALQVALDQVPSKDEMILKPTDRVIDEASATIGTLRKQSNRRTSNVSDFHNKKLLDLFNNSPAAQTAVDLLLQIKRVSGFTQSLGDLGGIARFTRLMDPSDGRSGIGRLGLPAISMGVFGLNPTALLQVAGGVATNRVARGLDKLTNRRSRPKRYVESVERKLARGKIDLNDDLAQVRERVRKDMQIREGLEIAKRYQAEQDAKESQGPQPNVTHFATEQMFESNKIPKGMGDFAKPWETWEAQVGKGPKDIYQTLQRFEAEGKIRPGFSQDYRYNIRDLNENKQETYAVQQMVRQAINPDFDPREAAKIAQIKEAAERASMTPAALIKKYEAATMKPTADFRTQKAQEGTRLVNNLTTDLEAARGSLTHTQYDALHHLKATINRADMTADDRINAVNDVLGRLFPNPVDFNHWHKSFSPLARHGNDYAIHRDPEAQKEAAFEERKAQIIRHTKKTSFDENGQGNLDLGDKPRPKSREDQVIEAYHEAIKADNGEQQLEFDFDKTLSDSSKTQDAQEPKKPVENKSKEESKRTTNNRGITKRVTERIEAFDHAVELAENFGDLLDQRRAALDSSIEGRIEGLMYDIASDQMTANMLVDSFASKFNVPPADASQMVTGVLLNWQQQGLIDLVQPVGASHLKVDDKYIKDSEGNPLHVLRVKVLDPNLKNALDIAKAQRMVANLPSQEGPEVLYTPDNLSNGSFQAFKNYGPGEVDASFKPLLDFVNTLRQNPVSIRESILTDIEKGLNSGSIHKATVRGVLEPIKDGRRDDSPMRTVAQLLWQLGKHDDRGTNQLFQEVKAGDNGRVYTLNGSASSQGGDIMKGLVAAPEKAAIGGPDGLNFMFHSFGNLLGVDKAAPSERRSKIFDDPDLIDNLLSFAKDPFKRNSLERSGKPTAIGDIIASSEGFVQTLSVAKELENMVAFARARHKGKPSGPSRLLSDPDVQADLAQNYKTDWLVQLDASNNAYQLIGLMLGDESLLRSTGLRQIHEDPDTNPGADIYVEPSLDIAQRIPELRALDLSKKHLRSLFKKAIGTFSYNTAHDSRKKGFEAALKELAGDGVPIFGVGDQPGLIRIPDATVQALMSPAGHEFVKPKYDSDGELIKEDTVRKRIEQDSKGKWLVYEDKSVKGGKFKVSAKGHETPEAAILSAYGNDFYSRVDRELNRDLKTRFPGLKQYMDFSNAVTRMVRERGDGHIKVPTPDGMMLKSFFKQADRYEGHKTQLPNGREVNLGYKTGETDLSGRGLASFMAHALDAWTLRESHKRLPGLKGFNPIHDSFGFHPSDAKRGQETVLQVMQELGRQDYNIFLQILEANGIPLADFIQAGGVVPERKDVTPQQAWQIPTALS